MSPSRPQILVYATTEPGIRSHHAVRVTRPGGGAPPADRILVLYKGEVVEQGTGDELFERPRQATRQLLQSIPGRSLLS